MDFTALDNLISILEKKSPRPGSPPEMVNGHLGVWRTIRHNRMFLEIKRGEAGGKGTLGRVLIGPPSFVGHSLDDVSGDAWQALTPRATLKEFNRVQPASNGIETLKQSIRNAIGPEDTRREALENLNTVMQLVPIARSVGFKDEEIKQALGGDSPNKPLSGKETEGPRKRLPLKAVPDIPEEVPDELAERREAPDIEAPKPAEVGGAELARAVGDDRALDTIIRAVDEPAKGEKNREYQLGEFLDNIKGNIKDDLMKKQVEKIAAGLKSGDYTVSEVKDRLKEISRNKEAVKQNVPKPEEIVALQDRAEIKEFMETFDDKLDKLIEQKRKETATTDLPASQVDSMRIAALESMIAELLAKVKSPQAQKEIRHIMESVRVNPFSKRSVFLRLYQILQILMLLIPVL